MTNYPIAILLTSILFCTATIVLAVMLKRANSTKDKLFTEMQAAMDTLQNSFADPKKVLPADQAAGIFADNLRTAELTTRLQQPRLSMQQRGQSPATPERYRYIQSMVMKGMSAQEIASTFSMSLNETTQLVALIRVANPLQQGSDKRLPVQEMAERQDISPATREQQTRRSIQKQAPAPRRNGTVDKSFKLARWLKGRALAPCLRKQSSRERPRQPLPQAEGISCRPLPGYT
jgi:hypothetical protein